MESTKIFKIFGDNRTEGELFIFRILVNVKWIEEKLLELSIGSVFSLFFFFEEFVIEND